MNFPVFSQLAGNSPTETSSLLTVSSSGESGELPYCAAGLSRSRRTPARTAGRSLTYPALRRNAPCLAHSCAIYTRKSSEEGLEQEFNSLQAQREACEAFITSQRHEGWMCLRAGYDDGGFSGATIDRPALQRLLADITAGRVETGARSIARTSPVAERRCAPAVALALPPVAPSL